MDKNIKRLKEVWESFNRLEGEFEDAIDEIRWRLSEAKDVITRAVFELKKIREEHYAQGEIKNDKSRGN